MVAVCGMRSATSSAKSSTTMAPRRPPKIERWWRSRKLCGTAGCGSAAGSTGASGSAAGWRPAAGATPGSVVGVRWRVGIRSPTGTASEGRASVRTYPESDALACSRWWRSASIS
eukprot:846842-Prymnesium_polylepis.3